MRSPLNQPAVDTSTFCTEQSYRNHSVRTLSCCLALLGQNLHRSWYMSSMASRSTTVISIHRSPMNMSNMPPTSTPLEAAHQPLIPSRENSFFAHLNRDIRNMIYAYTSLSPIRTAEAKCWVGFAASCQQARREASEEGVRHMWELVNTVEVSSSTVPDFHPGIRLPRTIRNAKDFVALKQQILIADIGLRLLTHGIIDT